MQSELPPESTAASATPDLVEITRKDTHVRIPNHGKKRRFKEFCVVVIPLQIPQVLREWRSGTIVGTFDICSSTELFVDRPPQRFLDGGTRHFRVVQVNKPQDRRPVSPSSYQGPRNVHGENFPNDLQDCILLSSIIMRPFIDRYFPTADSTPPDPQASHA